jgi:hypothetical protein
MFQNNLSLYQNMQLPGSDYAESMYARQYNTALNRFNSMLGKGKFARLKGGSYSARSLCMTRTR